MVIIVNGDLRIRIVLTCLAVWNAGEAAMKPMLAAIANAIHDATGVRLRRVPFRDDRVLAEVEGCEGLMGRSTAAVCARTATKKGERPVNTARSSGNWSGSPMCHTLSVKFLRYVELKSGYSDDGPAWISYVNESKSGWTSVLQWTGSNEAQSGHCSVETQVVIASIWRPGSRFGFLALGKDGQDRHRAGIR